MAEKDPSLRPSFRRTRNLRPVPKVGFSLSVASISPFMRPRPILIDKPLLSTNEKLMGSLSEEIILRPGNRAFHTHPKLPGVEFTSEECADAAAIALSAQKYLVLSFSAPDGRLGMPDTKALVQDARFWSAAKSCDAEAMMACALKEALVSARAAALNTGNGAHASRSQARDDVEEALMFTEEYIYFKAGGEDSLPSIKRMSGLEKEFPESSFYELATKALDAKREGRQLADPDMEVDISGTTDVREEVMEETKMLGDLLETLIAPEKALIEKITGAKELDTKSLRTFLSMHPGKRDLLLQRGINRQWLSNGWREGLGLYQDIYRSIYAKCGIAKPTSEERREAALDPSNLSEEQRLCVSFIFPIGPDEKITPAHIIALDIWLRADREELERIWDQMYPSWTEVEALANEIKKKGFTTDRLHLLSRLLEKQPFELGLYDISSPDLLEAKIAPLRAAREMWFSPSKEERMDVWRYGSSDLFATASISHKLRYGGRYPKFTKDEDRIASFIFPGLTGMASLDRSAKEVAADIFRRYHTGREMPRRYHQIIYELARLPGMDVSSLRRAAYREAEFKTLSRFLGAPDTMPQTQIVKGMWGSRAKDKRDGSRPVNEDSCSSVEVVMEEGDVIRLDMVADGMGGHKRGDESSHETNGQAASRIAKEVFEICALAGWIMTPEDARLIVMMADLAIVKEQIGRKTLDDPSVENDMGCTMSIILQRNDSLWGVHAGDSDWKVFRNGEPVLLSIGHTGEWGALQDVRKEVEQLVRADLIKQGFDPYALDDDLKSAFNSRVDEWTHDLFMKRMEQRTIRRGGTSSALGHAAEHIHINNAVLGYRPLKVQADDIIVLCSDGVGVPICNHEFGIFAKKAGGDLAAARDDIVQEAAARVGVHEGMILGHTTLCECTVRKGKPASDDATLMMRYATGATMPMQKKQSEEQFHPEAGKAVPSLPQEAPSDEPPSYDEVAIEFPGKDTPAPDGESASVSIPGEPSPRREGSGLLRLFKRGPKRKGPLRKTKNDSAADRFKPTSIFHSQVTPDGSPLSDDATRWFDKTVREMNGSEIVQDVARALGLLPRDLEIMVFYAYCGDMEIAKDPRHSPVGWELIGMIPMHLMTVDAERILRASYLIYMMKEHRWDRKDRESMFQELLGHIKAMQNGAEHTARLEMEAFGLQGPGEREDDGKKGRKKGSSRGGIS